MIVCKNCGRENEDEYKFCLGCGSALPKPEEGSDDDDGPEMIDCPHCGTRVPQNFKFCGACGGPISDEAAAASGGAGQAESTGGESDDGGRQPAPVGQEASSAASDGGGGQSQPQRSPEASPQSEPAQVEPAQTSGNMVGHLTVIRPDGSEGADIPLMGAETDVGRESPHEVLANDPFLSPHHATFVFNDGSFLVRDEESLNGVFLRIRDEVELSHGDMIRLGQELLRFELISELDSIRETNADDEETRVSGSPDTGYWARLSLIAGPGLVSQAFSLGEDAVQIGRETGDIVFRDDGFVSGKHARVSRIDGKAYLKDLGSSNGTYLRIRGQRNLQDGDLILMGQQLFRLVVS